MPERHKPESITLLFGIESTVVSSSSSSAASSRLSTPPSSRAKRGICSSFTACLLSLVTVLCPSASGQRRPERPKITRIDHVAIYASDLKATRDFYAKLGLNEGGAGCVRGIQNCLTVNWATRQRIELELSSSCPNNDCLGEIVFRTANAQKLRNVLVARGIKASPIERYLNVSMKFEAQDPEGHRIGFVQILSIPVHDPPPGIAAGFGHIIHAGFVVHDRAAMEKFYRDILGFRPYWHGGMKDDQIDWVSLQVPDGTDWIEFMVNVPPDADHRLLGVMNHIALGVPDIHAAAKQLLTNGMKLTEEPKIGRDGKRQLNLYDPDQTRVELMEFTPVEKPCCSDYTGPHPKP